MLPLPAGLSLLFFFCCLKGVAEEEEDLSRASSCALSGWSDGTRALGRLQSAKNLGLCLRVYGDHSRVYDRTLESGKDLLV